MPLFDNYHLTAAFEHHDHAFKRTHLLRANQTDPGGTLYLGDGSRRGAESRSRIITTVAGTGVDAYSGDGGPALQASMNLPHEIRFDRAGDYSIIIDVDDETLLVTSLTVSD